MKSSIISSYRKTRNTDYKKVEDFPSPFSQLEKLELDMKDYYQAYHIPRPFTLIEKRIIAASQTIRRKQNWMEKINSIETIDKWKNECKQQGLEEDEFQFVIEELKGYYLQIKNSNDQGIEISLIDGCYQSDSCILIIN